MLLSYANILSDWAATLQDPEFISAHRVDTQAFSRQRTLMFPILVGFLLCVWKGGLQALLDEWFESRDGQLARVATKRAVFQARRKLKGSAFVALNDCLLLSLEVHCPGRVGEGSDSSADAISLRLPENPQT